MSLFSCHEAREIVPGLLLGGLDNLEELRAMGTEVLFCLCEVPPSLSQWPGELLSCPIEDGGVLEDNALEAVVEAVLARLEQGKRVGIFCLGGHGRTGYVAACVLARLGINRPISYLQKHYCRKAVETEEQVRAIRSFQCLYSGKEHL